MKNNSINIFIFLGLAISIIIFIISIMININMKKDENRDENKNMEIISEKEDVTFNIIEDDIIQTNIQEGEVETVYLVKDNNGYITIYATDENGDMRLKETTQIVVRYLPNLDKEKLKDGIFVKGKEELNKLLEDYE